MSNKAKTMTLGELAQKVDLPTSKVAQLLNIEDNGLETPVTAKQAENILTVVERLKSPSSASQKQLTSTDEPSRDLAKVVANEIGVPIKLTLAYSKMRLGNAYNKGRIEQKEALMLDLAQIQGKLDAKAEYQALLQSIEDDQELKGLSRKLAMEREIALHNAQYEIAYKELIEPYKPVSFEDEVKAQLAELQAENDLIEAIGKGYIPTDKELENFIVEVAYRLHTATH